MPSLSLECEHNLFKLVEKNPYVPINVMPHLPPPEPGGDKGGDLTDNSDPTHGAFDLFVY